MFVRWIKSAQTSRTLMPGVWQSYANLPSINDVFYLVGFVDLLFKAGERHFASVRLLVIGVRQCGLLHLETKRKTNDILDGVNARVRGGGNENDIGFWKIKSTCNWKRSKRDSKCTRRVSSEDAKRGGVVSRTNARHGHGMKTPIEINIVRDAFLNLFLFTWKNPWSRVWGGGSRARTGVRGVSYVRDFRWH